MQRERSRLAVIGLTIDALLGAIFLDANYGQSISLYVAIRSRVDGAGWAKLADWYLSVFVEKDHCGKVLRDEPMSRGGIVRAALQIGAVFLAICYALGKGVDALAHLILGAF